MYVVIYDSRKITCNKSYLTPGGEFYYISWDIVVFEGKKLRIKILGGFFFPLYREDLRTCKGDSSRQDDSGTDFWSTRCVPRTGLSILHTLCLILASFLSGLVWLSQFYELGGRLGRSHNLLKVTQLDLNPVTSGSKAPALFLAPFASSAFAIWSAFRVLKLSVQGVNF